MSASRTRSVVHCSTWKGWFCVNSKVCIQTLFITIFYVHMVYLCKVFISVESCLYNSFSILNYIQCVRVLSICKVLSLLIYLDCVCLKDLSRVKSVVCVKIRSMCNIYSVCIYLLFSQCKMYSLWKDLDWVSLKSV